MNRLTDKPVDLLPQYLLWTASALISTLGLAVFFSYLPRGSVSLYLFSAFEPSAVGAALVGVGLAWFLVRRDSESTAPTNLNISRINVAVLGIAVAAALLAAIGHFAVYHDHTLSVDEFMTRFGAAALSHGDIISRIPEKWRPFSMALQPIFTFFGPGYEFWGSPYRPVNAAVHAIFGIVPGGDRLANPALVGLSVFLATRVALRIWPEREDAAIFAAIGTATSAQVLANGMTYYAMPAHLAFDLAWLLFFLRGGISGYAIAALIGFFAVGLHQINFHPLFVIPFLLPLLFSRRWPLALFYAVVYAAALLFWLDWFKIALWWSGADSVSQAVSSNGDDFVGRISAYVHTPGIGAFLFMATNLTRFISWQSVLLLPFAVAGLAYIREAPAILRQAAWGVVLGALPFFFLISDQGHGWGYRYEHGFIGNVVLIGAFGWTRLVPRQGSIPSRVMRMSVTLAIASIVLLGVRAVQIDSFVKPYAEALRFIRSQDADVVVIDSGKIWFGADLDQNDPYLRNRPKIMSLADLQPSQIGLICQMKMRFITPHDLPRLMANVPPFLRTDAEYSEMQEQVARCSGP
jgi:hypothetical protein